MIRFAIIVFVLLTDVPFSLQEEDNVLHIGGIFPIGGKGGWQGGQACEPAVRLALEDVNKNSILSGYQLKLHWNDSEVSSYQIFCVRNIHSYSYQNNIILIILKMFMFNRNKYFDLKNYVFIIQCFLVLLINNSSV